MASTIYGKRAKRSAPQFTFKTLPEVMLGLNHTKVDILKFDIEGAEWELITQNILPLPWSMLPAQLLFELHGAGANPKYVSPSLTNGKTRRQVNKLFLGLHDRGYRILSSIRNRRDHSCSEFSLVLVENETF